MTWIGNALAVWLGSWFASSEATSEFADAAMHAYGAGGMSATAEQPATEAVPVQGGGFFRRVHRQLGKLVSAAMHVFSQGSMTASAQAQARAGIATQGKSNVRAAVVLGKAVLASTAIAGSSRLILRPVVSIRAGLKVAGASGLSATAQATRRLPVLAQDDEEDILALIMTLELAA